MWDERLNLWVSGYNDEQNFLGGHLLDLEIFSIIYEMLDIKCKKKNYNNAVIDWSELVSIVYFKFLYGTYLYYRVFNGFWELLKERTWF